MLHYWSLEGIHIQGAWLTIGSFDGVHLGHQEIIRKMTAGAHAAGSPAVVLAFYPHPSEVLRKRQGPIYLTTPEERAALLEQLGVDLVISHPFNHVIAGLSARQFMERVKEHLGIRRLFVGHDFALGRGREGNIQVLAELGKELGYKIQEFSQVTNDGDVISSSLIRSALAEGDVEKAWRFLGRPFGIEGEVIHGDARGKALGIPTANLAVWSDRVVPKVGVYVCQAHLGAPRTGQPIGAVVNIGVRPTFEDAPVLPRVEAHLLDFDDDLYGRTIHLDFTTRLRGEQKFPNIQALVDQIHNDIRLAREHLAVLG